MIVFRLGVLLYAGAFIIGGVFGQRRDPTSGSVVINIAQMLPESTYSSCKLKNSRTGVLITCTDSYHYDIDCYNECYNHVMYLYHNNILGSDMFDIWNLIGKFYEEEVRTGCEIAYKNDTEDGRSSSGPQRTRRVEYRPAKLPNLGYNSCRLENQAGTTIYCGSILSWVEIDEVDCNEACASFVHSVTDIDKIKGSWTLIGQFYYDEDRRTGFDVIVEDETYNSEMTETEFTDTTTEMEHGTTLLDDGRVIVSDSSFIINIPYMLEDVYHYCQLSNSITGEIINCTRHGISYSTDCNDLCSHYALHLAKINRLDTGIWNLIGTHNFGDLQTAFEIAKVRSVHKRRSIKYTPSKLESKYITCKLRNQAGTTIYCKTKFRIYNPSDDMDCNKVCATFVDRVIDIDEIKGNWTLIGETYYDRRDQTGFEILVEDVTYNSETIETDYTDTTTEEATEVATSGTTENEYTDRTTTMEEAATITDDGSGIAITIAQKLPSTLYSSCRLSNSRTGALITCKDSEITDCNRHCYDYVMNLYRDNKLGPDMFDIWNLIGFMRMSGTKTGFEIAYRNYTDNYRSSSGPQRTRRVEYKPAKLPNLRYKTCRLQNQAGTTIYCRNILLWDKSPIVDCNEDCASFVYNVTDIDKIKGSWTLIGEFKYGGGRHTGFEIIVEEATDDSETTETDFTDTTPDEATTITDDGLQVTVSGDNFFPYRPYVVVNIPHKLPATYRYCAIQNSLTGNWLACEHKGFIYWMDCNTVCSNYILDLARRNFTFSTGIWNLIGKNDYHEYKTSFEITKVRSANKRGTVKCRSEKLKSKYNFCKLQNQARTTIHCKSIHPWSQNDELDCYDACAAVVGRVIDIEPIIGNWTLIGETFLGRSDQTDFEILMEEATGDSETFVADYTDTTTEEATEVTTSGTPETEYTDTTTTMGEGTTLTDDGLQVTFPGERRFPYRPYVMVNIPHKLPGTYRSCRIQNTVTGEWLTCLYNGFIFSMDCNKICSNFILDLVRRNDILDTGIWNLIGKVDYSQYKTAFEITKVRSTHKRRSVKYRSEKLKSKYNYCKLQNQEGTTIHCKSINPWGHNDKLDCYAACVAVVDRVIDIKPIIGNWTLMGDFYYRKGDRTGFEIIAEKHKFDLSRTHTEEVIDNPTTTTIGYFRIKKPCCGVHTSTTKETAEVSTTITRKRETENTNITTTKEQGKFFENGAHINFSDSNFLINIPNKLQEKIYDSCKLNDSQTGELLICGHPSFYHMMDCNTVCSLFALDLVRKNVSSIGLWNMIGRTYAGKFDTPTALEITRVGIAHKNRSVKYRPKKLKRKYKSCRLQNQAGTTIYCQSFDPSSNLEDEDCNDACATIIDQVRDVERIKGNWTLIGETHDIKFGQTGLEILVYDPITSTTEEATEVSTSDTTETVYKDIKTALLGATISTAPGRTLLSRSSDEQADRVVVEIPRSLVADQDLHFALSLVPMMRQRNLQDKLNAQIDILSYFKSKLANRTP